MNTKAEVEKVILEPNDELFLCFEGVAPDGAFMTAWPDQASAERFCVARSTRFPCYWRKYAVVVDNVAPAPTPAPAVDSLTAKLTAAQRGS